MYHCMSRHNKGTDSDSDISFVTIRHQAKTVEKFGNDSPTVFIYRINGIPASLYPRCSVKRQSENFAISIECFNARSMVNFMSFDSINSTKLWFFLRTRKFLYKTPVVLDNTNLLFIAIKSIHISCTLHSFCYFCGIHLRIMAQSVLTIRLDSDLKMQFDSLCEEFGMSTNTAFNIYVRQWSDL